MVTSTVGGNSYSWIEHNIQTATETRQNDMAYEWLKHKYKELVPEKLTVYFYFYYMMHVVSNKTCQVEYTWIYVFLFLMFLIMKFSRVFNEIMHDYVSFVSAC